MVWGLLLVAAALHHAVATPLVPPRTAEVAATALASASDTCGSDAPLEYCVRFLLASSAPYPADP